ncbi:endothelin-converting enzyme 1-like [Centruroides sculpturatus]|uniref:endothelin-converting enzyme 1-like n=1 Tax=Centruroides sculpturatus TaxID=218467 RepID=UPI000C6ECEB4|nr:endothelin-converting enzyme 1-like [Centruroides sculpturatus]
MHRQWTQLGKAIPDDTYFKVTVEQMDTRPLSVYDSEVSGAIANLRKNILRDKRLCIPVIALSILIFSLIITVIVLAVSPSTKSILNSINESVDPCEDFYQFSCGRWIAEHEKNEFSVTTTTILYNKLDKDFKEIFELIKEEKDLPRSVKNVMRAFHTCMHYDGLNPDSKAWIKNITRQAGGFPLIGEYPQESSNFNWTDIYLKQFKTYFTSFPFLIKIDVNPFNSSENIIHISPHLVPWMEEDKLYKLVNLFEQFLYMKEKEISDILWFKEIFSDLTESYYQLEIDNKERQLVKINELKSIYPEVDWLPFLNNLFDGFLESNTVITGDDKVLLDGKTCIKRTFEILKNDKVTKRLLLNYGGAIFAMEFLDIQDFLEDETFNYPNSIPLPIESEYNNWVICKAYLGETTGPVFNYLYGRYKYKNTASKEMFDYIVKVKKELVDQSTWLDEPTRKAIQDKLDHMVTFIGLPPWTQDVEKLDEYYKLLPEMADNFYENVYKLNEFKEKKDASFYGKKNDRTEWLPYFKEKKDASFYGKKNDRTDHYLALIFPFFPLKHNGLDYDKLYWIINKAIEAGGFPLIDKSFNERRLFYNWPDVYIKQFKTYFISSPLLISIYSNYLNTSENVIYISIPNSALSSPNKEFLRIIASFFGSNKSADKDIEDILWLHNYISNISRPSSELLADDHEYELIKINELKSIYPDIDWLSFLKNLLEDFLETGTTITGNDKVFLLGKTYIKTILELLNNGTISQRLLLNYGGSAFLTELFTYNYLEGSSLKLKHKTATNVKWSQCKSFFTQTVSPALDYLYGKYREEKFISEELIDYMMMAMKEMVNQSTWLDELTKEEVQDKVSRKSNHFITLCLFKHFLNMF